MEMILRAICILTTVVTAFMMTGCGNTKESSSVVESESSEVLVDKTGDNISVKSVLEEIDNENLDGKAFIGEDVFKDNCMKFFGLAQDSFADAGIIFASGGGLADEVSMIKTVDSLDGEEILRNRLEERSATFENYKPQEMDKIGLAQIFQTGDFWVLVISDNVDTIKEKICELVE